MAATKVKHISPLRNPGNRYLTVGTRLIGEGAIAASDSLVTDVRRYPVGTEYYDLTNKIRYTRVAVEAEIGDWYKSVADTAAS